MSLKNFSIDTFKYVHNSEIENIIQLVQHRQSSHYTSVFIYNIKY